MIYGYARVSKKEQNLQRQINALEKAGVETIITEKESGVSNRPALEELIYKLKKGDKLIVKDISRFGRDLPDFINKMDLLSKKGIEFISLDEKIENTNNPEGEFQARLYAALADFDRKRRNKMICEGIKASKKKSGRPKIPLAVRRKIIDYYENSTMSKKTIGLMFGVSRATVYNIYNEYLKNREDK